MSFTAAWDESQPDGAVVDSADIDLWDRNIQRNMRERIEAFLGITDFVAQTPALGTSLKGNKLDVRGVAASSLLPGATSFAIRNNADTQNNLLIADAGDVTVRNNLAVLGALAVTGAITGAFQLAASFANAGTAPGGAGGAVPFATEVIDTDAFHNTGVNNSRFTVPAGKAGNYLIIVGGHGSFYNDLTGANTMVLKARKNNTTDLTTTTTWSLRDSFGLGASNVILTVPVVAVCMAALVATDYVEANLVRNATNGSDITSIYFGLIKIS